MKLGMALPWVLSTPSSGGRLVSLRDQLALPSLSCSFASGPVRRSPGHRASQTYLPAARWKSLQLRPPIAHAESRLQLPTCRLRKKLFAVAAESTLAIRHGVFAVPNFFFHFLGQQLLWIGEALSTDVTQLPIPHGPARARH
jgi:hypothetical protein